MGKDGNIEYEDIKTVTSKNQLKNGELKKQITKILFKDISNSP